MKHKYILLAVCVIVLALLVLYRPSFSQNEKPVEKMKYYIDKGDVLMLEYVPIALSAGEYSIKIGPEMNYTVYVYEQFVIAEAPKGEKQLVPMERINKLEYE